ncbi:MAG: hypothetical protein XD76_1151 [candidate division TA06 bacterium 32_111]|uniref:Translocation and assembly module TamB C-terminal domain-containing protein n=2 Tax=Bacteria candidate phyla TaxID=1783234 RepID=A0A101I1W2_UNCT6|nr:MAG: hypothetical protein XD76_1151 [candidate division TA06 bacterium 32_111]KUK87486.1 MAG: hypothetical protein XE03_0653 [candidate division TA06 bacterium 34_109]HAF08177.1 hypothetical protein [candidate division WOR-3 bacterium]HCP16739.1 hypothetical protein [candidate division WOR-3 bacterium]
MDRKKRTVLITLIIILVLYISNLIFLNFGIFNRLIKSGLENLISKSLKGTCQIEKLKGNLNRFQLKNLKFENENISLISKTTNISLSLSSLLFKRVIVNKFYVEDIVFEIKENQASPSLVEKNEFDIKNFKFSFVLPDFENKIKIDINNLEVNNFQIHYKDIILKNKKFLSSLSLGKRLLFTYYKFYEISFDTFKVNNIEGEFSFFLKDSIVINNTINSDKIFSTFKVILKDSFLQIKNFETKVDNKTFYYGKNRYNVDGKMFGDFILSPFLDNGSLKFEIKKFSFNEFSYAYINGEMFFKNDTLNVKNIECDDKNFCIVSKGFIDFEDGLNGEFTLKLDSLSLESFLKKIEFKKNKFYGKVNFKTNFKDYLSLNIDSVRGSYGEFDDLLLNGLLTFNRNIIFTKNLNLNIKEGSVWLNGNFGKKNNEMKITFEKFPLSFVSEINKKINLGGNLNGFINLKGRMGNIFCENSLEIKDFNLNNSFINFLSLNSKFFYNDGLIDQLVGSFYALNGTVFKKNLDILYAEVKKKKEKIFIDMDAISEILSLSTKIEGELDEKNLKFLGNVTQLDLKTDVDFLRLTKPIEIKMSKNDFSVKDVSLEGSEGYAHFELVKLKDSFTFDFEIMDKNLLLTRYFSGYNMNGDALIFGNGFISDKRKRLTFSGKSKNLNYYELIFDSLDFNCEVENNILKLNHFNIYNDGNHSYLFGDVLIKNFSKILDSELNLNVKLSNIGNKYFVPLKNIFRVETKNGLSLEGKILGTLSDPKVYGEVKVDSSNIYIVELGTEITNVEGHGVFEGDILKDIQLRGLTEKGKVEVVGEFEKKRWTLGNYHFDIVADGFHSNGIDYVDAFGQCSLKIYGDKNHITTSGLIFINEGVSNFPFFIRSQEGGASSSGYITNLDLKFVSDGNLWLKNSFVNVELKGEVNLKKDNFKYNITGNAEVIRGTYFYLEKRFSIERGIFTLRQSSKDIDPFMDILASTNVYFTEGEERKEAKININVKGSTSNPKIVVSSDPPMSLENIISVLSFNTTLNNITNLNDFTRTLPEKALQIYLRNRYLNIISSSIGVDQLDVNTSLLDKEKSAKLSVGKYIGKKLYLSYTHDIFSFSKDQFKIEYKFGNNTSIVTERDEQGNFNGGIKFILRF